jgi:hypothetical protein
MIQSRILYFVKLFGLIHTLFIILFIVGFFKTTPHVFLQFTFVVKVLMAIYLLYRFNPYTNKGRHFTLLDREIIIFSSAFILVSSFTDHVNHFLIKTQNVVTTLI